MNTNISTVVRTVPDIQNTEPASEELNAGSTERTTQHPAMNRGMSMMRTGQSESNSPVIVVTEERSGDEAIIAAIAQTLELHRIIPRNAITVAVRGGEVALTGYVDTPHDREIAAQAVQQIPGVRDVDNRIEILNENIVSDRLHSAVVEALLRRARRIYEQIGVEMKGGRVVLTGNVGSIAEKRLVLDIVGWTHHVQVIEDRLEII